MSDEETTVAEHLPSYRSARAFEVFHLEGPAALMTPGYAFTALSSGLGVASEEVGAVDPIGPGALSVEIEQRRASRLTTPRDVPTRLAHGSRALFQLTRPSDPPTFPEDEPQLLEVVVRVTAGSLPGPSALAGSLSEALQIAAEDIGFALEGHDFLRLTLPLVAARHLVRPLELTIAPTAARPAAGPRPSGPERVSDTAIRQGGEADPANGIGEARCLIEVASKKP